MVPLSYYIEKGDISNLQKHILEKHNIHGGLTDCPSKAHIIFLRNYTYGDKVMDQMKPGATYCFGIKGMDEVCGKSRLYKNIVEFYGRQNSLDSLIPNTFTLIEFAKLTDKSTASYRRFILKKDVQRQEGLRVVTAQEFKDVDLKKWVNEKFVVVQEFLTDPLIIKGRKCNLRVYVLVVLKLQKGEGGKEEESADVYIYQDGFMYYTPLLYHSKSVDEKRLITSGYVDRYVYQINPLTHTDLKQYLGKEKSEKLFNLLVANISLVFKAIIKQKKLLRDDRFPVCFQLFGVDIQPNSDLSKAHILEINKNPDLTVKDENDGALKEQMQKDIFNLVLSKQPGLFLKCLH